jgi:hypothetical protein
MLEETLCIVASGRERRHLPGSRAAEFGGVVGLMSRGRWEDGLPRRRQTRVVALELATMQPQYGPRSGPGGPLPWLALGAS